MENIYKELKDIGNYRIVRSSEDRNAMIGWGSIEYDKHCKRWFESTGGGYCTWKGEQYLLDEDELESLDFCEAHPNMPFRESYWNITWGEDDVIAERALFVLEEFENGEHHAYNYIVDDVSQEELAKWRKAVWGWHMYGELKLDNLKCDSSWETEMD